MVDKNDPLLREIDEELRREQWEKLWERYGTIILGVALGLIALVGGYKYWESHQLARSMESGSAYNEAMKLASAGKADESAKKLDELAASAPGGYAALAELQRAGAHLKAGRPLDAATIFDKVAKNPNVDSMLKSFAVLQAATVRSGEADFTEMQNRLNPLTEPSSPWRHHARELLGLAALKAGKTDEARAALGAILGDPEAPQSILERVRVMLSSIASAEMAAAGTSSDGAAPAAAAPTPADGGPAATDAGAQPK